MQMLEPPEQQRQQRQKNEQRQQRRKYLWGEQPFLPLNSLRLKVTQISADLVVLLLSIFGITIVFAVSLGLDLVIILMLNRLFGTTLGAGSMAGIIFSAIQYISYLGAGISYFLMVFLLLGLYTIGSLSQSWRTTKKDPKPLKTKVYQLLQDTSIVLIDALRLFLCLTALIVAIALALFLTSQVLSPATLFLEAVKIFTAFAIVIAYVVNVAPPLWRYGKDIFHKLFEKPGDQKDRRIWKWKLTSSRQLDLP